ncbi:MAG TPA: c-type cytochrome [Casimicrobiaceae bacterium]|nr:c-type cytochrome [Casimicrobiaceae bacterium]
MTPGAKLCCRPLHPIATLRPAGVLFATALLLAAGAAGQEVDRSGKQVVESLCISCHATGASGAPKIGDKKAWSALASQGLASLTRHALDGIRQMPPHGGNPSLSDTEIERAITYMVNQSGGHWTEPASRTSKPAAQTGEQIYEARCSKCHRTGVNGAPRVGDTAAWIPRLKQGIDIAVRSAIHGHGGMPARGGQADLTDAEFKSAVVYMINPNFASVTAKVTTTAAAPSGPDFRIVDGTAVYFGAIPADAIRRNAKEYPEKTYGVAPMGPDQYYVTIAVYDARSGKRIPDADVRARISTASSAGPEKALEPVSTAELRTYGNYFAMGGSGPYEIAVHIRRPGAANTIEAKFAYER